MPRRHLALLLVAGLALSTVVHAQQSGSGYRSRQAEKDVPPRTWEVLIEGGAALPGGNLGAEFLSEEGALGAETGYTLGARVRFYLTDALTVAPAFAYTEFGDLDGIDAEGNEFVIVPRVIRYGLDLVLVKPGTGGAFRPYAGLGAAFVRNKYRDELEEDGTYYAAGANGLAWSAQAGLRWRDWELSVSYEVNTFSTARFLNSGGEIDYDWSSLALRLGVVLPRI